MKNIEKFKKSTILCLIILICAVLLFTGCSEAVNSDEDFDGENMPEGENISAQPTTYGYYNYAADRTVSATQALMSDYDYSSYYNSYDSILAEAAPAAAAPAPAPEAVGGGGDYFTYLTNLPAERKIIRDANLVMEVESAEKSYDNILLNVVKFGGYEASRDMRMGSNNYMAVNATLKIPSHNLDMFLNEIKNEGTVLSSTVSSSDVTDAYYDSQTRLTTLEKTLAKYYEFLDGAKDVDEQLRVLRYINEMTDEIEQIKGRLKRWDSLVDYSTVMLYLYRPADEPEPTASEPETTAEPETETERSVEWSTISGDDMRYNIMQGLADTCSVLLRGLQMSLTWIISVSPVLAPVILVLFFVYRYVRKKMRVKKINKNTKVTKNNNDNINNTDNNGI